MSGGTAVLIVPHVELNVLAVVQVFNHCCTKSARPALTLGATDGVIPKIEVTTSFLQRQAATARLVLRFGSILRLYTQAIQLNARL